MNVAILIPPNDFSDETVSSTLTLMQKWGVTTVIASGTLGECVGHHGARLRSSVTLSDITTDNFDGIIIPDGVGVDTYKMYDARQLLDIIKHFNQRERPLAFINNSVKILARANVITNKKIASISDRETVRLVQLFRGTITNNELEADGNIITLSNTEKINELVDAMLDRLHVR